MTKFFLGFWFGVIGILWLALSANDLWAAGGGGGITGEVFWQIISFVLLLFLLTHFLKKPVRLFLKKRQEGIKNSLEQSAGKKEESRKQFENWEGKFDLLRQEVADLHQKISQEGEAERKRIIGRAEEEGNRIRQQARVVAEQEVKKARATLRKEMVDLSVELAEKLLKEATQPRDQGRLVREYVERMKEFR
jgi:F-type H+-transporting ATPase subunit b